MELPVRTEFGFVRTECACEFCKVACQFMPGYLIPSDLERLAPSKEGITDWALTHLRASPGAILLKRGTIYRIKTLVPAKNDNGNCHWYENDNCSIHANSPFACAFFTSHMSKVIGDPISLKGLGAIEEDWKAGGIYSQIWNMLSNLGLVVPGPEKTREKMERALELLHAKAEGTTPAAKAKRRKKKK